MLIGESGTGKEFLARSINRASERRRKAFHVVDLSAISPDFLAGELFGYFSNGIFHKGKIELADHGTILIKGIEAMPSDSQAKLLRLMRQNIIYPPGPAKPIKVDVRIMATTKRDFADKVKQGCFSDELYRLLSANIIRLSPLRTCRDDLALIIEKIVKHFAEKYQKRNLFLEPEAKLKLIDYDWPGNFREIESRIERLVFLSNNDYIKKETLCTGFNN